MGVNLTDVNVSNAKLWLLSETEVGSGGYNLSDGDVIEWHYTCSLGEDLR